MNVSIGQCTRAWVSHLLHVSPTFPFFFADLSEHVTRFVQVMREELDFFLTGYACRNINPLKERVENFLFSF